MKIVPLAFGKVIAFQCLLMLLPATGYQASNYKRLFEIGKRHTNGGILERLSTTIEPDEFTQLDSGPGGMIIKVFWDFEF